MAKVYLQFGAVGTRAGTAAAVPARVPTAPKTPGIMRTSASRARGDPLSVTKTGRMQAAHDRYLAATPGSRARFEEARRRLAGGVNRGGMIFQEYPLFIERATGCYLYDVDGREVLD